jgi:hypothetical protein
MTTARDDFSWVPRYPAPLTLADVPEHLRDNPLERAVLAMSPDEEAARAQATANGLRVDATAEELDALCVEVPYHRATWDDVRAWFAARLHPAPPNA